MKKYLLLPVALMSSAFISCDLNAKANEEAATKAALETQKGKHSYAIGMDMGRAIKQIEADLDHSVIIQGIKAQLDSTKPALMNDSEFTAALQDFMLEMRKARMVKDSIAIEERMAERRKQAAENHVQQTEFLEKNKGETGVVTTESGLQYIVLTAGKGGKPAKDGDTLIVHYTGTLLNGTEFDSSIKRNQPFPVVLGETGVISGWVEMLRLMKKGDKVKVWIPSSLGYGENGRDNAIVGNDLLIFDMELLDVKAKK
jgi:FKBP-type peptidyl-prolyl cis-trans isomerase